jgi:hypothetical protein
VRGWTGEAQREKRELWEEERRWHFVLYENSPKMLARTVLKNVKLVRIRSFTRLKYKQLCQ